MKLSWVHSISLPVEPSRLESPRATWAKPVVKASPGGECVSGCISSGFIKSVIDVCSAWVPFSVSVLCSPAEVNLRTVWRRQLLHITTLAGSQTRCPVPPWSMGWHLGAVALPYSKGSAIFFKIYIFKHMFFNLI